jgi:predicted ArsR family transcriptional regulator
VDDNHLNALGTLVDPTRRRVYEAVAGADGPLGRDDVAQALAIGRTLAAFHLDKLAEAGLLEFAFARPDGRSGPGAGRPAKLYRTAARDVAVQVPPRNYPDLSVMLAEALDRSGRDEIAYEVARAAGAAAGRVGTEPVEALAERGYAPVDRDGTIVLRNCPFHAVAHEFPPLICGMNLALVRGMAEAGGWACTPELDPQTGRCCVTLRPSKNNH